MPTQALPRPKRPPSRLRRPSDERAQASDNGRQAAASVFFRESVVVFNRQLRMNLRNPAWVLIGVMQPILYLVLFGPLLEPLIEELGGNAYNWFVPGMLVQLGIFGAMFAGFSLIGEWR